MVVGALGTWATALGIVSVAGTRSEDGWFVLGAGVLGLVAIWSSMLHESLLPAILAVLCGLAGAVVSGIDLHKLASIGTTSFFGNHYGLSTRNGAYISRSAPRLRSLGLRSRLP